VNPKQRERQSSLAVNLGLVANLFLAALKTSIGVLGHSPALLADGINSTSDVAYYLVVIVFMKLAREPADTEHPYGHSQLESIAALIVGSFVITTAIAIFWSPCGWPC
jgi:cation diffusion facilitator family transporter